MASKGSRLSRRHFMHTVSATLAGIAAAKTAFAQSLASMGAPTDDARVDGGYWARVRAQFMMPDGFGYLNTGRLAATPRPVFDAMVEYWRLMAVNPTENSAVFEEGQEAIRIKAAQFVGASPDEVAITRNTTEGLVTVINGLDLKAGDEILHSFHEHSSNLQPWSLRAKRHGVVLKEVPIPTPPKDPDEILTLFADAITPRTRVITTAHITTVTGCVLPIKELAKLARSRNILFLVDGAHGLGMVQLNLGDLGPDTYATTSHKWLASPAGTGLLYVRRELVDRIWPNIVTQSWYQDKGARKYDRLSRRPWPQVAVLEDALHYQGVVGRSRIENRMRALSTYLRAEAAEIPNVLIYTSNDPRLSGGMTTLGIKGMSGQVIHDHLRERYDIFVSPRTRGPVYPSDPAGFDGIRISTHFYNTFEQVDRVLQGLRELSRRGS
jgi:selenocysteine lyase/cysteine desulfurase